MCKAFLKELQCEHGHTEADFVETTLFHPAGKRQRRLEFDPLRWLNASQHDLDLGWLNSGRRKPRIPNMSDFFPSSSNHLLTTKLHKFIQLYYIYIYIMYISCVYYIYIISYSLSLNLCKLLFIPNIATTPAIQFPVPAVCCTQAVFKKTPKAITCPIH